MRVRVCVTAVLMSGASVVGALVSPASGDSAGREAAMAALLSNGMLVGYSASGDVVGRVQVGDRLEPPISGSYVAVVGSHRVGVLDAASRPNQLVFIDVGDWSVVRRSPLPSGTVFRHVAVGPRTGNLYVAGDQPTELTTPFESLAHAARLAVLDSRGRLVASEVLRDPRSTRGGATPHDWSVNSLAIAADERSVVVSYHGPNTEGADIVRVERRRLTRCRGSGFRGIGCVARVHGSVAAFGKGFLAATGTPADLLRIRPDGTVTQRWKTGSSLHLMEFARVGSNVFALGSCPKLGGLLRLNLDRGDARMISPPAPAPAYPDLPVPRRTVCGDSIEVVAGQRLAIAKNTQRGSYIQFVEASTGRLIVARWVTTPTVNLTKLR